MLDKIISWDTSLFQAINSTRCPWADYFFALMGSHLVIGLVVVVSGLYVMKKNNWKHFYLYILAIALCFLLSDRISVICFKDVFCRLRPSHSLTDVFNIKFSNFHFVYGYKGGLYGFVSSHAANCFSIITALSLILLYKADKTDKSSIVFTIVMVLWGLIVGYSRIYCGYHYPTDVFCGALLGIFLGLVVFVLYVLALKKIYNE